MKLPETLNLGPYKIKLIREEMEEDLGQWRPLECTIALSPSLVSRVEILEVLIHECLHAICSLYHMPKVDKEEYITNLAMGLTQMMDLFLGEPDV